MAKAKENLPNTEYYWSDGDVDSPRMSPEAPSKLGNSERSRDRNPGRIGRSMTNHRKQRSWSSESSGEEAWLKKKDQIDKSRGRRKTASVERSVSDCGPAGKWSWPVDGVKRRHRARSLTDEDLDELRGFIDLGFRFNYEEEDHRLCNTLPALDLYYAVNRQYIDCCKFKPDCSLERSASLPITPLCDTWTIASPGDNPQHVKTRLRHWAQAVACSVRQSC